MNETENRYLSLKAAAQLYGYTRDHLGLMIRQGKLNGTKLGSYYVVTNESMLQYIKRFADPGHPISKNKMSNKFLMKAFDFNKETKKINALSSQNQVAVKKSYKKEPENSLEKKLREDLSMLSASKERLNEMKSENYITLAKAPDSFGGLGSKLLSEQPYIILPIRKMNVSEREDILSRTLKK